jgi:hypothetical protein
MTDLRSALHDYLTIRRQLGYELKGGIGRGGRVG